MNRRQSLKGASLFLAGAAVAACGGGNAATGGRKNFLLVHGAWHSSLHWNRLAALLTGMGHIVHAIDLPGAGLNAAFPSSYLAGDQAGFLTEASPLKDLHLADYRNAILQQIDRMVGNGKVTLVGHSMGGLSVTAAAEAVPDKIARAVYLTAFVPILRKTGFDYMGLPENAAAQGGQVFLGDPALTGAVRLNPRSTDAGYLERARQAFYNDVPMADAFRFMASLVPDVPVNVALEDARGTPGRWGILPHTYIRCTLDNALPVALQDLMIREADAATPGNTFDVKTLVSSHSPFASMPDKLAALLHELG